MSEETTYSLQLRFDSDNPEFCRGFEAAGVFRNVKMFAAGEHPHKPDAGRECGSLPGELWETVHASNAEMMLRVAEATGTSVRAEEVGGGWLHVCFVSDTERLGGDL